MRRLADPVQVLTGTDDAPQVFRWRGRRYVVGEVLGYWLEVAPWWQPRTSGSAAGGGGARERQRRVWRVEAGGGVFDLGHEPGPEPGTEPGTGPSAEPGRWLLVRVLD